MRKSALPFALHYLVDLSKFYHQRFIGFRDWPVAVCTYTPSAVTPADQHLPVCPGCHNVLSSVTFEILFAVTGNLHECKCDDVMG